MFFFTAGAAGAPGRHKPNLFRVSAPTTGGMTAPTTGRMTAPTTGGMTAPTTIHDMESYISSSPFYTIFEE